MALAVVVKRRELKLSVDEGQFGEGFRGLGDAVHLRLTPN